MCVCVRERKRKKIPCVFGSICKSLATNTYIYKHVRSLKACISRHYNRLIYLIIEIQQRLTYEQFNAYSYSYE